MPRPIYLDTARLGKVSPTALAIQTDYLRFSATEGSAHALRDLLSGNAWPAAWQRRYPFLTQWRGISALKERLREIVGAPELSAVMLANRPQALMLLAAHLLVRNCACILTTDLAWPPFQAILRKVAMQAGRHVVRVGLRRLIRGGGDADRVTQAIVEAYRFAGATALFLPAISHDGIQLPLDRIAAAIQRERELRFFAVDGAQHLAHGTTTFLAMDCDFYLAGTHKWLRSLYPLGVACYGQRRSQELIETTRDELRSLGVLNDPLIFFASQLEGQQCDEITETINLSGLLSAYGAALDAESAVHRQKALAVQLANAGDVQERATDQGWRPLRLSTDLRSGIQLFRPPSTCTLGNNRLQTHFEQRGLIATTYDNDVVRLSMPRRPLTKGVLDSIHTAFRLESGVAV